MWVERADPCRVNAFEEHHALREIRFDEGNPARLSDEMYDLRVGRRVSAHIQFSALGETHICVRGHRFVRKSCMAHRGIASLDVVLRRW